MSHLDAMIELLRGQRTVVLTGAGCSTESGIPDYRGPETARRARNPIQYRGFLDRPAERQRYWARSMLGWPTFSRARPNAAHHALAAAERDGLITGVITQNVDRLHQAAGSLRVVELHGALAEVRCLSCDAVEPRTALQARLTAANPAWRRQTIDLAPDGDAVPQLATSTFSVPSCLRCRGVLKPNVVFFGESVPRPRVAEAWTMFEAAERLLVVGSSLTVFSGYRFVRRARSEGKPVAIVNLGETRGDRDAAVRLAAQAGRALPALFDALRSTDTAT